MSNKYVHQKRLVKAVMLDGNSKEDLFEEFWKILSKEQKIKLHNKIDKFYKGKEFDVSIFNNLNN